MGRVGGVAAVGTAWGTRPTSRVARAPGVEVADRAARYLRPAVAAVADMANVGGPGHATDAVGRVAAVAPPRVREPHACQVAGP